MTKEKDTTLAEKLNENPHLFDPDVAKFIKDTLPEDAPEVLYEADISNPTNLYKPTDLSLDTSRAGRGRISANYMGMIGPVSALPSSYTHAAISERKRKSSSFFDFMELFANELRNLFVMAHRKYRLPSLFQLYRVGEKNQITSSVFSLMGFSSNRLREKMVIHEEIPLYYAGYFADNRRTAINLERMLFDFLNIEVKVEQFVKRTLPISREEQTRLGEAFKANAILGQTAISGQSSIDRRGAIRIKIGPVKYSQYLMLMPDRELYPQLVELVRLYCGISVAFDIQIILAKEDIPQTKLNQNSPIGRLGWDCWVIQSQANEDSKDTIFDPDITNPI